MNFKQFTAEVKRQFPHLDTEREGNVFWTTDGSISYDTQRNVWDYRLAKSSAGSGSTLEEAIADADRVESEDLSMYDG